MPSTEEERGRAEGISGVVVQLPRRGGNGERDSFSKSTRICYEPCCPRKRVGDARRRIKNSFCRQKEGARSCPQMRSWQKNPFSLFLRPLHRNKKKRLRTIDSQAAQTGSRIQFRHFLLRRLFPCALCGTCGKERQKWKRKSLFPLQVMAF